MIHWTDEEVEDWGKVLFRNRRCTHGNGKQLTGITQHTLVVLPAQAGKHQS